MSEFYEVDEPIINDAYEEPREYWLIKKGEQPTLVPGRRPAQYFWRPGKKAKDAEGRLEKLEIVNRIRDEVKRWRSDGYPGATAVTRELLDYWERPEREKKIIFAQREAATTTIFLREAAPQYKQGLAVPRDDPTPNQLDAGYQGLERLCIKMATGSGKTTVMGLLAAWSILNKIADPKNPKYSDTIVAVCPNVTIRERLAELDPRRGKASIYGSNARDIVPTSRMQDLARGLVIVTNWHILQPREGNEVGGVSAAVVNKGTESDRALVDRVLGPAAKGKKNILVFNDEAHHAYRIPPDAEEEPAEDLAAESDEEERKEATVWIDGLEKIQKERRLNFVVDLSATPLIRYGPDAGKMFPWVVSDFALVDAIESGLVKIPQLPVADTTGREVPEFFNIWDWIVKEKLSAGEKGGKRASPSPDAILRHAKYPIQQLAGKWRETFKAWAQDAKKGIRKLVPPVFIIVCRDTKLAKAVHEELSVKKTGEDALVPEFVNSDGKENTIRIDSKVVQEIESGSKESEARRLRFILDTVGLTEWRGGRIPDEWKELAAELNLDASIPPGRDVRCIVSVGMLTEGWDATTVTHIVGIRPFQSQLLCEQVVGRALRRSQWTDLRIEEVAQIFGVPFEIIPFKAAKPKPSGEKTESHHVFPRPDREALAITFPRVERYVPLLKGQVAVDWDRIPQLILDPLQIPSETVLKSLSYDEKGRLTRSGPGKTTRITLEEARKEKRQQKVEFDLASRLTKDLSQRLELPSHQLFPRLYPIVKEYFQRKVVPKTGFQRIDVALYSPWFDRAFTDLSQGLGSADNGGTPLELPVYDLGRPEGSTFDVDFWTSRPVYETTKSHLNFAVADTKQWEQAAAYYLEQNAAVAAYAKNFDMGFTIPYLFKGERHEYHPDYLVRIRHEGQDLGTLVLEIKGYTDERAMLTKAAAERWIDAVNQDGRYGVWDFRVCSDPADLNDIVGMSVKHFVKTRKTTPSKVAVRAGVPA